MPILRRASWAIVALLLPVAARAAVVINEIMYNTPGSPDVEYVELYNTGPAAQALTGWYLLDDNDTHAPCALSGTVNPGQYLIVAGNIASFMAAHPGAGPVNPNPFDTAAGFALGSNDTVRLFNASAVLADRVAYLGSSPWPPAPNGGGPSLELLNPALDNEQASNWGASVDPPPRGTPGAQNSVFINDTPPLLGDVGREPQLPGAAATVSITATVTDDDGVTQVQLFVNDGSGFIAQTMHDDGLHLDGAAGDSVYGASIPPHPTGTIVRYYVEATDTLPQTATAPGGAPAVFFAYTVDHVLPPLAINEIVALNESVLMDQGGDFDDWLEIRNRGPEPVDLGGMFLTDDLDNPMMSPLPPVTLDPGAYLLVWCDEEPNEGPLHAGFKLGQSGEEVGLFETVEHGNVLIHGFAFGVQNADVSFGFLSDDADVPDYLSPPTPAATNNTAQPFSSVCINEFLAGSQLPGAPDWIELHNRSSTAVDVGDWHLSDDNGVPEKYTFPAPMPIPPGGFLAVDQNELGFALALDGDEVLLLTSGDGTTAQDFFDFGAQAPDVSQGRFPDGGGDWHFFSPATRELANSCNPGIPPLQPVGGLRFASKTALAWSALAAAEAYDVVRGHLAPLRAGAGFASAVTACLENNRVGTEAWADASPPVGAGFFYLVRGVNHSCGFGTYDSGSATQVGPRDAAIAASPAACP